MIIICNKCNKKFNVENDLIPEKGRLLKCSNCNNEWFFNPKFELPSLNDNNVRNNIETSTSEDNKLTFHEEPKISKKINVNKHEDNKNENADIKKNKKNGAKKILNTLFVVIITFIAIIILADTFKYNLTHILPGLVPLLDSLYAILNDLKLFIKDLIS